MKNRSLEIHINNEQVAVGGIDSGFGGITAIVRWLRKPSTGKESFSIEFIGMDTVEDKTMQWLKQDLEIGDSITMAIGENKNFSPIIGQLTLSKELELEKKLQAYKKLKEELKDYL